MSNVAENHLMVSLKQLAEMLPSNEARRKLYEVAEGLMRVAAADGILRGLLDGLIHASLARSDYAKFHLAASSFGSISDWPDYLVQEGNKYQ